MERATKFFRLLGCSLQIGNKILKKLGTRSECLCLFLKLKIHVKHIVHVLGNLLHQIPVLFRVIHCAIDDFEMAILTKYATIVVLGLVGKSERVYVMQGKLASTVPSMAQPTHIAEIRHQV